MELNFNRKALILGITLVLLVVAYALGIVFSPANVSKRLSSIPLYPVMEKAEVEEIYLEIDGDRLQLTKSSRAWTVQISSVSFPASDSRIDSFLDQIAALKRSQEITSNPDLWADFELTEGTARRVTLKSGVETVVDLLVHTLVTLLLVILKVLSIILLK